MLISRFSSVRLSVLRRLFKMIAPPPGSAEDVKSKTISIQLGIANLRKQISVIEERYNNHYLKDLLNEQKRLKKLVEDAQKTLVNLEIKNGVVQISVPKKNDEKTVERTLLVDDGSKIEAKTASPQNEEGDKPRKDKEKKEKKPKEPKQAGKGPVPPPELPVDVGRLDLRIAKIQDVQKHPDADTLYVLKIDCGEDKPRTVCSGLVKHIPKEDLESRFVMLLCNLKPQKMRGITSEAMVMCASTSDAVEVLIPPENCKVGDLVYCEGYERNPDDVLNPKKKIFEAVAPDLHTNDKLEACYKGVVFNVPGKGNVVARTLKNVPVK